MTSRRAFLGLFAAAPFVAPAVVKAALEPQFAFEPFELTGEYSGGFAGPRVYGGLGCGTSMVTDRVSGLTFEIANYCPPEIEWTVPNRLYGAQLNHEGDAI